MPRNTWGISQARPNERRRRRSLEAIFSSLLAVVASSCASSPRLPSTNDPGPPDARWRTVATRPLESATLDPGIVACEEADRHSFEHEDRGGWSDHCGWRRHTTCSESYHLYFGTRRTCEDSTPAELFQINLDLHVRRVFAAEERCEEGLATLTLLDGDKSNNGLWRETSWRVTGCGKRARILCRAGPHASGYVCNRMEFRKESSAEAIAEVLEQHRTRWAGNPCAEASVVGDRAEPVSMPDGRPGLTVAVAACQRTFLYTCLRPDLVPPGSAACGATPLDPLFTVQALEVARVRVAKEHRCELRPEALRLVGETVLATHRSAVFRVTSCNATRDVQTVRCVSQSLVDGTVRSCTIDSIETETHASLASAGELAAKDSPPCGADIRRATVLSTEGERHLVHVVCFGTNRAPLFYACKREVATVGDGASCVRADAIHDAVGTLELGAGDRFSREEFCPVDKTRTSPVEPHGRGMWRARASGCGVTRDYLCKDLAGPITQCTFEK